MRGRKLVIALAITAAGGIMCAPASAELHRVSVTLVTGQQLFMTIDVPPGISLESMALPGLPAPVLSVTDLGIIATPGPGSSAEPADTTAAAAYLLPFPVVRIRGSLAPHGANVTLFRVTAPSGARVTVRCAGDGCPIRRRTRRAGRIRALERFLPAGVRITVRVRRQGYVGKYARIRIRAGKPPARRDACLISLDRRPATCPRT